MNNYDSFMDSFHEILDIYATPILVLSIIMGISLIILTVSLWKLFSKCGEKGWKALIPFYNIITLMKIIGMNCWFLLLLFIPVLNLFFFALLSVTLANQFGKGAGFAIGILFLPFIFVPILAFSKCELTAEEEEEEEDVDSDEFISCPNCHTKLSKDSKVCFICQKNLEEDKEDEIKEEKIVEDKIEEETDEQEEIEPSAEEVFEDVIEKQEEMPHAKDEANSTLEVLEEIETDTENNLLELESILKELDQQKEEIKEKKEHKKEEAVEVTLEPEEKVEEKIEEVIEPKEEKKSMDDILKVDQSYEARPYQDRGFRSSSKTLDDILKINQDLYSTKHKQEEPSEEVEILDFESEVVESQEAEPVVVEKKKENKICPNCGSKVPGYSDYCIFCGEEVK